MSEGGEGFKPTEKDAKMMDRSEGSRPEHSQKKRKMSDFGEFEIPQSAIDNIDLDQAVKDTATLKKGLIKKANEQLENLGKEKRGKTESMPEADEAAFRKKLLENPVITPEDYPNRNLAFAKLVDRLQDDPELAGFEDLAEVLKAEEKDVENKKTEMDNKKNREAQSEALRLELVSIRAAQEALGIMIIGGQLNDNDPISIELMTRTESMLQSLKKGHRVALNESVRIDNEINSLNPDNDKTKVKLEELKEKKEQYIEALKIADRSMAIYEILLDKISDYSSYIADQGAEETI